MIAPSEQYDVVIVGAGPGGSALATLLGREGLRVALVEKDPERKNRIYELMRVPNADKILPDKRR